MKDGNKELAPTAIVEGTTVIRSRRQLSQIIDTTLLKCYLKVINLGLSPVAFVTAAFFFECVDAVSWATGRRHMAFKKPVPYIKG